MNTVLYNKIINVYVTSLLKPELGGMVLVPCEENEGALVHGKFGVGLLVFSGLLTYVLHCCLPLPEL